MNNEFLRKLLNLCNDYDASLFYTSDDDGIHVSIEDEEIYVGHFDNRD